MKPFNLELAKAGHPVQTRDGRKVRIVCWDMKADYPIIALIEGKGVDKEVLNNYNLNGYDSYSLEMSDLDIVMAPTKHEGWVNIYPNYSIRDAEYTAGTIFNTEEEAKQLAGGGVLATIHIEWEE